VPSKTSLETIGLFVNPKFVARFTASLSVKGSPLFTSSSGKELGKENWSLVIVEQFLD